MGWIRVATRAELAEGGTLRVEIGGEAVCLYDLAGTVYATQDVCTHAYASLSEGYIEGDCIECPLHQALFHIPSGEVRGEPATEGLRTYRVRMLGEHIEVEAE